MCQGSGKKLTDCGAKYDSSACSHDQDVILECHGGDGDTSGIQA